MDVRQSIITYLKARYSILAIVTPEEARATAVLASVAQALGRGVRLWSCVQGFTALDGSAQDEIVDPQAALVTAAQAKGSCLFVLRDFHPFLDATNPANVGVIRTLREVGFALANGQEDKTIVLLSPKLELPDELQAEVATVEWALPTAAEIRAALTHPAGIIAKAPKELKAGLAPDADLEPVVQAALGLPMTQVENACARSLVSLRTLDPQLISGEKKQAVLRAGVEWIDPPQGGLQNIAGMDVVKGWLRQRKAGFSQAARDYGLDMPKGFLVIGPPGTGKSALVAAAGAEWGVPILSATPDAMAGGLVGESEAKTRKLLNLASTVAPCILRLDEVEKLFAGAGGSGEADSGVGRKVFGMVLTWMQEKKEPVFVAATANDVTGLPPELLRKGRFDELWFVDLPTRQERAAIFAVHLGKRKRDPEAFDLAALAAASDLFTGAEIEAAVVDGMFAAFTGDTEVTTTHILEALSRTVPLSTTAKESLDERRKWARGRARWASAAEEIPINVESSPLGATAGRFGGLKS